MSTELEGRKYEYTGTKLAANTVVAAVAAGAAAFAVSGLIVPALLGAGAGAIFGYSATNRIPKIKH